jgi:hypothetical protein
MRKLPVFKSAKEVYAGVFSHFMDLAAASWLPLAVIVGAATALQLWVVPTTHVVMTQEENKAFLRDLAPAFAVYMIFLMPLVAIVAVNFHRFVLLGERGRGAGTGFEFGRKELLYLWSLVKIMFILAGAILGISVLVGILAIPVVMLAKSHQADGGGSPLILLSIGVLVYVAILAVFVALMQRLMLALPHVALGNASRIWLIWRETKGNMWRLLGYYMLIILPVTIILVLLPMLKPVSLVLFGVLYAPFLALVMMLSITMLSVAYREIIGLPAAAAPEAGEPA